MDVADFLKAAWPYAIVAAPGLWAVWKQWNDGRKGRSKERVDLLKLAQEVAADAIKSLQDRVEALEEELTELRKEHAQSIASKDAEIALLRGEVRQWQALADAYERQLTEAGVPHEKPSQPIWRVPPGNYPADVGL